MSVFVRGGEGGGGVVDGSELNRPNRKDVHEPETLQLRNFGIFVKIF